jgi:hypothetical protein
VPWPGPIATQEARVVVARADQAPVEADLLVRFGPVPADDAWNTRPHVALDASTSMRRHVARHPGIGAGTNTPYGVLPITTGGTTWQVVYLTGEQGRVGDEQSWWMPRALDAEPLVVAVDRDVTDLFPEVLEQTAPLALAIWIGPTRPDDPLPHGAFGPLRVAPGADITLAEDGATVRMDGRTYTRRRGRWTTPE